MPQVSVIIPVYNVEKYLRRCLDSVRAQTFTDWEAICVNDGSPDKCGQILAEYAATDPRFRVINKENTGVSDSRNVGVAAARGEYILFVDSDDFIHPQTLELSHALATRYNADTVSFRHETRAHKQMRRIMKKGGQIANFVPKSLCVRYNQAQVRCRCTDRLIDYATERNHALGAWRVRHCYPVLHLIRRDFINSIKFDTNIRIAEDFPWWTQILAAHPRAVIMRSPLYYYVPNTASALNATAAGNMFKNICAAIGGAYAHMENAPARDFKIWTREFLWPFIIIATRMTRALDNPVDIDVARRTIAALCQRGVFDNPPTRRARRYRRKIAEFIK